MFSVYSYTSRINIVMDHHGVFFLNLDAIFSESLFIVWLLSRDVSRFRLLKSVVGILLEVKYVVPRVVNFSFKGLIAFYNTMRTL